MTHEQVGIRLQRQRKLSATTCQGVQMAFPERPGSRAERRRACLVELVVRLFTPQQSALILTG